MSGPTQHPPVSQPVRGHGDGHAVDDATGIGGTARRAATAGQAGAGDRLVLVAPPTQIVVAERELADEVRSLTGDGRAPVAGHDHQPLVVDLEHGQLPMPRTERRRLDPREGGGDDAELVVAPISSRPHRRRPGDIRCFQLADQVLVALGVHSGTPRPATGCPCRDHVHHGRRDVVRPRAAQHCGKALRVPRDQDGGPVGLDQVGREAHCAPPRDVRVERAGDVVASCRRKGAEQPAPRIATAVRGGVRRRLCGAQRSPVGCVRGECRSDRRGERSDRRPSPPIIMTRGCDSGAQDGQRRSVAGVALSSDRQLHVARGTRRPCRRWGARRRPAPRRCDLGREGRPPAVGRQVGTVGPVAEEPLLCGVLLEVVRGAGRAAGGSPRRSPRRPIRQPARRGR